MKKIIILFLISTIISFVWGKDLEKTAAQKENKDYQPGAVLVKFKTKEITIGSDKRSFTGRDSSLNELNNKFKVQRIDKAIKFLDERKDKKGLSRVYKLEFAPCQNVEEVVRSYKANSEVEWAEPNYIFKTTTTPNDPYYSSQWALPKISAPSGWDIEKGLSSVKVAVIDTGVDWNHPDLAGNIWINSNDPIDGVDNDGNGFIDDYRGWDFVSVDSSQVYPGEDPGPRDNDPMDFHGHGTHCAGIVAAVTNNSVGVAGVAWNCKIMAIRAAYKGTDGNGWLNEDDAAAAISYAASMGADVISLSWGGSYSYLIDSALQNAYTLGCILVAAAGNNNSEVEFYPAALSNVLAVAATDSSDYKAGFSNYGSWVDVSAPGVSIYSTVYDDNYVSMSGTSMACPHVAGLAALVKSKYPSLNNSQIMAKIISSTDNIDSLNPGYEGKIGSGRINLYRALLPFVHPSGTLIQVKSPYSPSEPAVYRIDGNQKRLIPDPYVYSSQFSWNKIIAVSTFERDSCSSGTLWPFRDGELVKEQSNPTVYVFENGQKRGITSANIFNAYRYNWNNIIVVPSGQLSLFSTGPNLSSYSPATYPSGSLLKADNHPAIYRIENGQKRLIPDPYVYSSQFSWNKYITVPAPVLTYYPEGEKWPFRDGELVKEQGRPEVYVFENGQKRWITDPTTFNAYGYSWSNVIIVPDNELNLFSPGENLSL